MVSAVSAREESSDMVGIALERPERSRVMMRNLDSESLRLA
jgi:hypothetical protein